MKFIISLLLGMMPEVLFLTLFIVFFRNIEKKRVKLFLLLLLGYLALIIVVKFQLLFYIAYIVYSYLIVKWLYKAHIIDFFVISLSYAYMTLISFGCFKLINDYWVAFAINRILLFTPLLFRSKIRLFYEKYKSLWNINKNAKIKSITVRNISLVFINILIAIMNAIMIFLISQV